VHGACFHLTALLLTFDVTSFMIVRFRFWLNACNGVILSSVYIGSISAFFNCNNCTRTHVYVLFKFAPIVTTTTHATARYGLILIFGGICGTVWCWLWTSSMYVGISSALLNLLVLLLGI